jgi:hypothetical protein
MLRPGVLCESLSGVAGVCSILKLGFADGPATIV